MKTTLLLLLLLSLAACSRKDTRYDSDLIDDLSGVWVYPSEQVGDTTITIIEGHHWKSFAYQADRINTDSKAKYSDAGDILGQEGVYFFASPFSFYSPNFLIHASNGGRFLIRNRSSYDRYKETGKIEVQISMRVSDVFDASKPPIRPSISTLDIPYNNIFAPHK